MEKVRIDPLSGCWNWTSNKDRKGYGQITVDRRPTRAHRFAFRLFGLGDPTGLIVCHRCDNASCVNPSHLFVGTAADNSRDMRSKGRSCRGEKNARAKLSALEVETLRVAAATGVFTKCELARWWNTSRQNVLAITSRRNWRHV